MLLIRYGSLDGGGMRQNMLNSIHHTNILRFSAAEAARRPEPLRICAVAYTFYESDGRVMRYNEALAARGDKVDMIALRATGQPRVSNVGGVRLTGVQTRQINERSQFSYLCRILLFFCRVMVLLSWRSIRSRYDIVHVHSVPDFLVFAAWLPKLVGAKIILDVHDLLPELYGSKFGVSSQSTIFNLLVALERISMAFADHVITANDLWHQRIIERSVSEHKATALLNFPDRSIFRPRGRKRNTDHFIIVYPGTLNRHQGLDIAVRAFAKTKPQAPKAEFHIYGAGPALPELKAMVQQMGLEESVLFKSVRPLREIARIMEDADLAVVPKRKDMFGNEAFSTKILEFMAMGVPVIVADTKIDVHYFTDSMVKFFRSGDVDDLGDSMLELINNTSARESLVRHAHRFIEANCWDVKKSLYFDLLDRLLGLSGAAEPRLAETSVRQTVGVPPGS